MHCMSVELNGELEVLFSKLGNAANRAYNNGGKLDLSAEKEYYSIQAEIKELYKRMAKFDQHLAEQLRKKHLKEKLGI